MGQSRGKFIEWIAYNPLFWNDFCAHEKIVNEMYFSSPRDWKPIHLKSWDVLSNCDNLNFDNDEVEAYGLLHFLDRYHRFQKIFTRIFLRGYFPTPTYPIDVLDIGCGPAPSLFALKDFVEVLRQFGQLYGNKKLQNIQINLDYLERSEAFRRWVSRYLEFSPITGKTYYDSFEQGSFREFEGLDFRKVKTEYRNWLIQEIEDEFWRAGEEINGALYVDHIETDWKHKYRYNMIIMSNFLTDVTQVEKFNKELISASYSLRNHGILIVITGATSKYDDIIKRLKYILLSRQYNTKKVKASLNFAIKKEKMIHNFGDLHGKKLVGLLQNYMNQEGFEEYCARDFRKFGSRSIHAVHTNKWYLTVFKKHFGPLTKRLQGTAQKPLRP